MVPASLIVNLDNSVFLPAVLARLVGLAFGGAAPIGANSLEEASASAPLISPQMSWSNDVLLSLERSLIAASSEVSSGAGEGEP